MAVPQKRPNPTKGIPTNQKPLAADKLIYVANKLNLGGLAGMQGSTRNIFDTVKLNTGAGRQTLQFFSAPQGKARSFSNFQAGTLQAGEALVIEEIVYILLVLTTNALNDPENAIVRAIPITMASATQYPNSEGFFAGGLLNIMVANSTVVKDYNTFEGLPAFNPKNTGMVAYDSSDADIRYMGANKIILESPPVLAPNLGLSVAQEIAPTGTIPDFTYVMAIAGRFGSLFAGKTTY